MNDLYVKDDNGQYVPIKLELASPKDLENKLIVITVGNDEDPASSETIEYVQSYFKSSKGIIEAMRRSGAANLLILPHTIKLELISKDDLDTKAVCIRLTTDDQITDLPEIKSQVKQAIRKDVMILPVPISLKEYKEVKDIKERAQIRKQRHGGGLNNSTK